MWNSFIYNESYLSYYRTQRNMPPDRHIQPSRNPPCMTRHDIVAGLIHGNNILRSIWNQHQSRKSISNLRIRTQILQWKTVSSNQKPYPQTTTTVSPLETHQTLEVHCQVKRHNTRKKPGKTPPAVSSEFSSLKIKRTNLPWNRTAVSLNISIYQHPIRELL